ncbi:MAG: hypothetical protein ACE5IR_21430 [bacterium]
MKRMIFAVLILTLTLGLGCNRSSDSEDSGVATLSVKNDRGEMTVKGGGEEVHFALGESGVDLPDGFPDDAPLYPGAMVATSATTEEGYMVALLTQTPLKKVRDFYNQELKKNGWKITLNSSLGPNGGMLRASKDQRSQYITFSHQAGTTTINLTVN